MLAELEAQIARPDFWNDAEGAQRTMQQRKSADERVSADQKLTRIASDIETYLSLAREESEAAQRQALLADTDGELKAADDYVAQLETSTMLSGESDRLNAILTIKPGETRLQG